jgi:hypothetical protein
LILLVPVLAITAAVHSQVIDDPEIRVVDDDAPRTPCPGGLPQGRCWENAFTDLQEALNAAALDPVITEIWVAAHSGAGYVPSEVHGPVGGPDLRRATYLLQDGLAVYGGFLGNDLDGIGNGETSRSQRNPEVNETVLTGEFLDVPSGCPDPSCFERPGPCTQCQECRDLVCAAFPLCCANGWDADVGQCAEAAHDLCVKSFNAYHVVTADGLTDTARLEGFTITDGLADGNGYIDFLDPGENGYFTDEVSGGGVLIDGSSLSQPTTGPIIARCRMVDDAAIFGGGLATQGAADPAISPILVNLEFLDNTAFSEGPDSSIHPGEPGIGGGA